MASPAYQDWQKYRVPGADTVVTDSNGPLSSYIGPAVDCSAWSYVSVVVDNYDPAMYLQVSVEWLGYNSALIGQLNDYWTVGPGQIAQIALPVRGRTLAVSYTTVNGNPTEGVIYSVTGTTHRLTKYDVKQYASPLLNVKQSFGAGQQIQYPMNFWYEGPVSVCAFADNTTGANLAFLAYDPGISAYEVFCIAPANGRVSTNPTVIYFPASSVQVLIQNPGAAQTVEAHVIPVPTQ